LALPSVAATRNDGSLEWVAEALVAQSSTEPCPLASSAKIVQKPQGHYLSFTMTNTFGRPITFYKQSLPWGGIYSVRIAALTADGQLLPTGFAPIDDFGVEQVTLLPEQTMRGDYDLTWRWNAKSDPPSGFPPDKLIVLIWAYTLSAQQLGRSDDSICGGATAFRTTP